MTSPCPPGAAELKRLCATRGIRPNRGRGQNFMVNAATLRIVVETAEIIPSDIILEPGSGPGGLTQLLCAQAARVIAVEIDAKLHALLAERLGEVANLRLMHADILTKSGGINPDVSNIVENALAEFPDAGFKIVANLPYRISTAFITAALTGQFTPDTLVVTVQKEVADRICATPGNADYGYLTVIVQTVSRVERVRNLAPSVFWPQPAVDSTLIKITPDAALRKAAGDLAALRKITSALFTHRRKQAARTLLMAGLAQDRQEANQLLTEVGADPAARPETLSVAQFIALAELAT